MRDCIGLDEDTTKNGEMDFYESKNRKFAELYLLYKLKDILIYN
jgi:hypothetical protein